MNNRFRPHSQKQYDAIMSDKLITLLATGIQFGKSVSGALRLKIAMHKYTDKDDNFIMMAPNYKVMQQSCLPAFLSIMEGLGKYHKVDACYTMNGGGTCFMRTATDPDAIVGITNVRHIWGDEAGLYSLYAWENMQARASFMEAPITLTTSPYSLNWVYRELIKKKDTRKDIVVVQARSDENPYFPITEYNRKKDTMEAKRFNMMYGGNWEKMEGLVYDVFSEDIHIIDPFTLPPGTRFKAAIDWGHTHPCVIKVRGITVEGFHYDVDEVYQTGMTITDVIKMCKHLNNLWGIDTFYCGPDRPENIKELNRAGITAGAANNDVIRGCDLHYELIKSGKYFVFRGRCPHTVDEYGMYHWPSENDLGPDQDGKERNPVKQFDDAMDCGRYLTVSTYHIGVNKRQARTPQGEGKRVVTSRTKPRIGAYKKRHYEEFT